MPLTLWMVNKQRYEGYYNALGDGTQLFFTRLGK